MTNPIDKKQAIKLSGLDQKTFDNYFKNANEFQAMPRVNDRGKYWFNTESIKKWKLDKNWRTVALDFSDYARCFDFALAQHFRGYVLSDWGTARQREFGQKITNWVKGQMGEVAVKKFLERNFDIKLELDFDIYDDIVPQDITGIVKDGHPRKPKKGVGIKSSKPKSAYLVLGKNELKLPERRSDIYIYCRPDVPDDHILRVTRETIIAMVKDQPHFVKYEKLLPKFKSISCEIAGWCFAEELDEVTSIPGLQFDNGTRFVRRSGDLRRNSEEWKRLVTEL